MNFDLVLLHPPSVYDFRRMNQFRGPISDVIPSASVFDMYPIGLTSIAGYLERFGFRVRIVNLAARMLRDPRFNVEKKIRSLKSSAFGVSLHWLPHAQGSIEIAKVVKRCHPDAPIIFGGLSATYYHRELIEHDCVDFVMRGDSTEKPMRVLMEQIKSRSADFSSVPNLTWKCLGNISVNPLRSPAGDLNDIDVPDYRYAARSVFKYRSLLDVIPYHGWLEYPCTALLTTRGCTQNCSLCGGSRSAYALNCERGRPAMRAPERLVRDIEFIQRFSRAPIFVIGDIRQGGLRYVDDFLDRLGDLRPKNELVFELFSPANSDFLSKIEQSVSKYSMELTLESGDEAIRRANGKFAVSNQDIIRTVRSALEHGCRKLDIFFMVGLPHQTLESALRNVEFCEQIHTACGQDKRLFYFVAPLAPFLDPASRAFEHPEKFGYKRLATTLDEHIRHLSAPTWEYILNYETDKLTREQIVKTMYACVERLSDFKLKYGLIDQETHREIVSEAHFSLAWLELVRNAVRAGLSCEDLPPFIESTHGAARTQSELRWKVKQRYPNLLSFLSMGFQLFLDEIRTATLRRISLSHYQQQSTGSTEQQQLPVATGAESSGGR